MKIFEAKNKLTTNVINIRRIFIAWSVEKVLKMLTQTWLEQKITD